MDPMISKRLSDNIEKDLRNKNAAVIFRKTAIIMIISELTGVIAVLIDGIITSQGLGWMFIPASLF